MLSFETESMLLEYLKEDIGSGDITSSLTPSKESIASIKANESCTLAGIEEISFLMKKNGLHVRHHRKDGETVRKGEKVLEVFGTNQRILTLERVCLNILGRMSGVATLCSRAKKIAGGKVQIAVTRKTSPGFQLLDKKAAEVVGCWSHRKNLSEMILIKDNHLKFFRNAFSAAKRARDSGKKFEIEVENEEQALDAVQAHPHILMLDNFAPNDAQKTIRKLRSSGFAGKIELSGGIRLKNLKSYINLGGDIISMGELTKNARIMDFSLDIEEVK